MVTLLGFLKKKNKIKYLQHCKILFPSPSLWHHKIPCIDSSFTTDSLTPLLPFFEGFLGLQVNLLAIAKLINQLIN